MTATTLRQREATLVSESRTRYIMGLPVEESLPSPDVPYPLADPFILVHEGRFQPRDLVGIDTTHPHRGFDNLWYVLTGTVSTGHSTGPDGAFERARLTPGSLLEVRTGRGVLHAEALGADEVEQPADEEFRGVLFWVNLARADKGMDPVARVVQPHEMPVRQHEDASVRVLVGPGSPAELGTPASILDVILEHGGKTSHDIPTSFQGFAYLLEGEASFGSNGVRAHTGQLVLMGAGDAFAVEHAAPGTRYLLMAGQPYGEMPRFGGPFVD